ncbi:MAG: hypothetical protein ABI787_12530 [Spartobacteria bacterium]
MKKTLIATVCLALVAGLSSVTAAETMKGDLSKTLMDASMSAKQKMEAIESYVEHVEKGAATLTRKEEMLAKDSLKDATDETWTKMHAYFDGKDLKRMKLYPGENSTKTEEFYFYNNEPVFAFVEKNGKGKENHDKDAVGSKYYFVDGKLIEAIDADGKMMDVKSADAEKMGAKLHKESTALRGMLK